jgi:DNA-directed RNA polymerase subunit M/transcription elongation factor TFIIS
MMWKFKSCPKCAGDLFVDSDMNGWYVECLQCGYLSDLDSMLKVKNEPVKKEEKLARAGPAKPTAK